MLVPAALDGRLLLLSVAIAILATYAAITIVERIRGSLGTTAFAWLAAGSVAIGIAFWGAQFIGMNAFRVPFELTFNFTATALARILAVGVVAAAFGISMNAPTSRNARFGGATLIGAGIVAVNYIGIAAIQVAHARVALDPVPAVLALCIAIGGTYIALLIASQLKGLSGVSALRLRALGALGFGLSCVGVLYAGLLSIRVYADTVPPSSAPQLNFYLPTVVALVSLFVIAAATAAALFDTRLRRERQSVSQLRELYARERRVAMTLQRALLPARLPTVNGIHFSSAYVPGTVDSDIGGDWFDAFVLDDGTVAISIGDAAGRGLSAAIAMNVARQALRTAAAGDTDPVDVLRRANKVLLASDSPSLVTAIFGIIDPIGLQFRYAIAGHPPPLLASADGEIVTLPGSGTGLPLGIFAEYSCEITEERLPAGAILALYTDGFIEYDRDLDAGFAALGEALVAQAMLPDLDPAAAIDQRIFGPRERHDDAAIMTITLQSTLAQIDAFFPARAPSAPLARTALRRFLNGCALGDERTFDVTLAAGEAVANAIEHAYLPSAIDPRFRLIATQDATHVVITVEDFGHWREPVETLERGRGIELMSGLASELRVEPTGTGTRVVLRFAFGSTLRPTPPERVRGAELLAGPVASP